MLGIALEGGGAKGAFHIGAIQACMEMGVYPPQAVAGTSIGAMNAAMIAQGDYEKARQLWENISGKDIYDPENEKLIYANLRELQLQDLPEMWESIKDFFADRGINNTNMRRIIAENIDPDKLMASPIDYGIVTFALPDFEAVEIFKEEMGKENIPTYILASAAFPGFQKVSMGQRFFVDGGVYDNCPVNMLLERGCDRVIAVRTNAVGITRYDEKDARVTTITPSEDLGSLMKFSPETARHNIELGYYDGLRALMHLGGRRYYLTDTGHGLSARLYGLPDGLILSCARSLRISSRIHPRRLLFERLLPVLFDELDLTRSDSYDDLVLAMIEDRAERCGIRRLSLYTAQELFALGLAAHPPARQKALPRVIDAILGALAQADGSSPTNAFKA